MQLDTLDLCAFFRENNLVVSEADCYMLVKQLDSNSDGLLNLTDIMNLLCPRNYTSSKNIKATRKHTQYAVKATKLSYAIEFAVVMVMQK